MTYYLQIDAQGAHKAVWKINGATIVLVQGHYATSLPILPGASVEDTVRRLPECSDHKVLPAELGPGEYFPRMARPLFGAVDPNNYYCHDSHKDGVASFKSRLMGFTEKLASICEVIEPTVKHLPTYGHAIRDLLILASTEVEAHWRGALEANGIGPRNPKQGYTTSDYVRLSSPMKLQEYELGYRNYPSISIPQPFMQWSSGSSPTKDIDWYAAYNDVKHDRERNLHRATLNNAFAAVTACAIMHFAEFGQNGLTPELRRFFVLRAVPNWQPTELYIAPRGPVWTPRNYAIP